MYRFLLVSLSASYFILSPCHTRRFGKGKADSRADCASNDHRFLNKCIAHTGNVKKYVSGAYIYSYYLICCTYMWQRSYSIAIALVSVVDLISKLVISPLTAYIHDLNGPPF